MIAREQVIDWYIRAMAEGASISYRWDNGTILAESEPDARIIRYALCLALGGGVSDPPPVVVGP